MGMAEVQQLTATHSATGTLIDFASGAYFTGTGTATIDGTIASGEWDGATCIPFAANVPGGGNVPAELCGMNDADNLYVAVKIVRNPDAQSGGAFFIDANGDGTIGPRDDYLQWVATPTSFQDWTTWDNSDDPTCPATASYCSNFDTARGGTLDGSGAYVHDGTTGIMEMTHPLASGDALDMDFATGSRAKVSLTLRTCDDPTCANSVFTFVPGGITMRLYVQ
jgi:hypothetical protein